MKNNKALAGLPMLLAAAHVLAAGGHFAVDDARIEAAGQCGNETWFSHGPEGEHLLHVGFKCGIGALELGAAGESSRAEGAAAPAAWSLQAKWVRPLVESFSIGVEVQPQWRTAARAGYSGTSVSALATWTPDEALAWHANLGRDLLRGATSVPRAGLAVEWTASARWLLVGERFMEQRTHYLRAGARFQGGERWSVDASRAQRLAGPQPSTWTLGVNIEFGR